MCIRDRVYIAVFYLHKAHALKLFTVFFILQNLQPVKKHTAYLGPVVLADVGVVLGLPAKLYEGSGIVRSDRINVSEG